MILSFFLSSIILAAIVIISDKKYRTLKDSNGITFSFSKIQLAFWIVLIISSLIAASLKLKSIAEVGANTSMLLALSGTTSFVSKSVEKMNENPKTNGLIYDILNGGDIHRLQAFLINLGIGIGFVYQLISNQTIPNVSNETLYLLGASSATYVGLKSKE